MQEINISKKIQMVIDNYYSGNLSAFARAIGVKQSTLHRQLRQQDEEKLVKYFDVMLDKLPDLSEDWLVHDEGEMILRRPRPHGVRSALNAHDILIGDLLRDAIDYWFVNDEIIANVTKTNIEEIHAVLANSEYPSFLFISALFEHFHFNPLFLFDHKKYREAWLPLGQLQFIQKIIGRNWKRLPSICDMHDWFGCTEKDAEEYLKRYEKWIKSVHKHGLKYENDDEEIYGEPLLKQEWLEYFYKIIQVEYIPTDFSLGSFVKLKIAKTHQQVRDGDSMKEKIVELQDELLNARERIIELQDALLKKGISAPAPTGHTAAPWQHADNDHE